MTLHLTLHLVRITHWTIITHHIFLIALHLLRAWTIFGWHLVIKISCWILVRWWLLVIVVMFLRVTHVSHLIHRTHPAHTHPTHAAHSTHWWHPRHSSHATHSGQWVHATHPAHIIGLIGVRSPVIWSWTCRHWYAVQDLRHHVLINFKHLPLKNLDLFNWLKIRNFEKHVNHAHIHILIGWH